MLWALTNFVGPHEFWAGSATPVGSCAGSEEPEVCEPARVHSCVCVCVKGGRLYAHVSEHMCLQVLANSGARQRFRSFALDACCSS